MPEWSKSAPETRAVEHVFAQARREASVDRKTSGYRELALSICCALALAGCGGPKASDDEQDIADAEKRLLSAEQELVNVKKRLLEAERRIVAEERKVTRALTRALEAEGRILAAERRALEAEARVRELEAEIAAQDHTPRTGIRPERSVTDPFSPDFRHPEDTPLHVAVRKGDLQAMTKALEGGADVDAVSNTWTPIRSAVIHDNLAAAELLIAYGADLEVGDGDDDVALGDAALFGYKAMAELLVKKGGADLEAKNDSGYTPLHRAVRSGHKDTAQLLLDSGANVDATDKKGRTPLFAAAEQGSAEMIKLLIGYGANANAVDNDGNTPSIGTNDNEERRDEHDRMELGAD
jgi:hypothetical protein